MTRLDPVRDEELHAYLDGELDFARAQQMTDELARDPVMAARVEAFRADKRRLAEAFAQLAERDLPAAWIERIEAAGRIETGTAGGPRAARDWQSARIRSGRMLAMAASVAIMLGGGFFLLKSRVVPADAILAQAISARSHSAAARDVLSGDAIASAGSRDALLRAATGLRVRVPDLARQGYRLVELDLYEHAATLRYRDGRARELTLFVRKSPGEARFDLLKRDGLRVCVWQDDVVSSVMIGDLDAGEMMRLASAAYSELNG